MTTAAMNKPQQFDTQSADQLRALGFKIQGDKRMALIRGDVIVSVVRHLEAPDLFVLTITVPIRDVGN
jgi:hypothetical protein